LESKNGLNAIYNKGEETECSIKGKFYMRPAIGTAAPLPKWNMKNGLPKWIECNNFEENDFTKSSNNEKFTFQIISTSGDKGVLSPDAKKIFFKSDQPDRQGLSSHTFSTNHAKSIAPASRRRRDAGPVINDIVPRQGSPVGGLILTIVGENLKSTMLDIGGVKEWGIIRVKRVPNGRFISLFKTRG
jgi:hypothetical protein